MRVPEDAEEMLAEDGSFAEHWSPEDRGPGLGLWRGKDGTIYVAGIHFGPGDVIFTIRSNGTVVVGDD